MRVMRGKTFEGSRGVWEKIEVELDSSDLLPEESSAPKQVQLQLLEVRADKNIVLFLHRQGKLSNDETKAHLAELDHHRENLMSLRPKSSLKVREPK